ncbi:MAG TPA: hypothetical protein VKQ54_09000 [Caulobacteraceae bacterium]|nr:hypothetical protein [Caulobacteraceae bacterium]
MDEIEQRACAHDMALIEVVSHIDREHVVDAISTLREGWAPSDPIRLQAICLLEEALAVRKDVTVGLFWLKDRRWLGDD